MDVHKIVISDQSTKTKVMFWVDWKNKHDMMFNDNSSFDK